MNDNESKSSGRLRKSEIKEMRMNLGKFLHDYYIKFGEEKYEAFLDKLGSTMEVEYGEPFSGENLRIMEAEFVTLSATIKEKTDNAKDSRHIEQ